MALTKANWSKFNLQVQETVLLLIIKWKYSFSLMHTNKKKLHNLRGSILSTFWIFRPWSHQPCQALSQKEVLFELFCKSWIIFQFKILFFESNIPTKESLTGLHLIGWLNFFVCSQSKSVSNYFYTYFCSVLSWNCTSLNKSESIFSGMCYWDKSKFEKPYQDSLVTNEQHVNGQDNIFRKVCSFLKFF